MFTLSTGECVALVFGRPGWPLLAEVNFLSVREYQVTYPRGRVLIT